MNPILRMPSRRFCLFEIFLTNYGACGQMDVVPLAYKNAESWSIQ